MLTPLPTNVREGREFQFFGRENVSFPIRPLPKHYRKLLIFNYLQIFKSHPPTRAWVPSPRRVPDRLHENR